GPLGPRAKLAAETDERNAVLAELGGDDLPDEERVRAGRDFVGKPALEPAERAVEEWRAELPVPRRDALPHPDRRHPAGEMLGEVVLVGRQERYGERPGLAEQ